ncbi:A-kinase anchor proteinB [Arachis hypogaea]|nr:A-kinase anchor proteinB [Arachis hypogaea]
MRKARVRLRRGKRLVEKMNGIELNLEGVKFKLDVAVPVSDDFEAMKKDWEQFFAFDTRGYYRGKREPDTIILRGVPSRWFAEPGVSSKPSMLVTHTIFSTFGKIRNINVAEDDDPGKDANEDSGDLVSGLL